MDVRALSDALQRKAIEELNEVPSRIQEDVEHIRKWIQKQLHLHIRTDDQHLLTFLRACKFSLQRTKEKIDCYYSIKTIAPELFGNRNPLLPELYEIFKVGTALMLPQKTDSTTAPIFLVRWLPTQNMVESMPLCNLIKVVLMVLDIALNENDNAVISGFRMVVDFEGFTSAYVIQCTPTLCKHYFASIQNAYPTRIKGTYIINAPSVFDLVYNASKPYMSQKYQSRFYVYKTSNIDKFYADIGRENLPADYGGEAPSVSHLTYQQVKKVEGLVEWFSENDKYGTDEALRHEASKRSIIDKLNMDGSFRELTID